MHSTLEGHLGMIRLGLTIECRVKIINPSETCTALLNAIYMRHALDFIARVFFDISLEEIAKDIFARDIGSFVALQ